MRSYFVINIKSEDKTEGLYCPTSTCRVGDESYIVAGDIDGHRHGHGSDDVCCHLGEVCNVGGRVPDGDDFAGLVRRSIID